MSLSRREFSGLCVAFGSFTGASALNAASSKASTTAERTVKFRDGTVVSALGQGSAGLGKGKRPQAAEEEALRTGLSLGMTVIDTAVEPPDGKICGARHHAANWSSRAKSIRVLTMASTCGTILIKPRSGLCAQQNIHDHAALSASCRKNKRRATVRAFESRSRKIRHSPKAISA
jgi:hypothetical protein